jgi:hypothetical protein
MRRRGLRVAAVGSHEAKSETSLSAGSIFKKVCQRLENKTNYLDTWKGKKEKSDHG